MATDAPPAAPIDRAGFQSRATRIAGERATAIAAREDHALQEADAEHDYRVQKALRYTELRAEGKPQSAADLLAEGDPIVARHKRTRNREAGLKKTAEYRVEECEANRAMLRKEVDMAGDEGWQ